MRSERVRVRRQPARGSYDRAVIDDILDQALVCHLAFVDGDQPYAIPTLHARSEDMVYVHGSSAGRTQRLLGAGAPVCLTVTLIDGLVLARSAFHHSVNYRSVVLLGRASAITEAEEKARALRLFVDKAAPGRWPDIRAPSERELKATNVLRLPITEASAKVRSGPPVDEPEDLTWPVWAGVVPLALRAGAPEPAPELSA